MALRRPPTHRVDAAIVYVDSSDSAWDNERVVKELAKLEAEGKGYLEHPYGRYMLGTTRYDLDAPYDVLGHTRCARDYLDESKGPVKWELHRLTWEQWTECMQLARSGRDLAAKLLALRYGLKKADGGPGGLTIENRGRWLSDKDMSAIWELDHQLPERLGDAVIASSRELTDDEKKA